MSKNIVVFFVGVALGALLVTAFFLSASQQSAVYYRGAYDECANVRIQDTATGQSILRPQDVCLLVVSGMQNLKFYEHFHETPIPAQSEKAPEG